MSRSKLIQTKRIFLTLLVCLLLVQFPLLTAQVEQIRIGTFNIEWLGDGIKDQIPRSDIDVLAIANIIDNINCDVVALQEIENEDALKSILNRVKKNYRYFIDSTSSNYHKVAILYEQSLQKIDEQFIHYSSKTMTYKRPSLYVKLKKNNQEFEFISVHLKSSFKQKKETSHDKSEKSDSPKEIRKKQVTELIAWMKQNQKNHSILLGDFNEEYENGTILKQIEKEFKSMVISKNMISCANPNWKMIDHIILPEHFRKSYKPERLQVFNHTVLYSTKNAPKISDHCLLYYTITF